VRFYLYEGGVGDALALTATIREYHKAFPSEQVTVSTGRRYDDVFRHNPHLSPRPSGGRVVSLETEEYNDRGNIAVSFGLQAGISVVDSTPEIYLTQEERSNCPVAFEPRRKVIAVDPWARVQSRRWTWERWDEVVRELRKRYLVVGIGRRDTDYVTKERDVRPLATEIDFTNRLQLRQTAVLLERVDLFLGMDSGGAHLAAAAGCPSVVIYSRSVWHSRAYWNCTPVWNIKHPCAPEFCNRTCGNPNGYCLDGIYPDRVLESVDLALRRFPRGAKEKAARS